MTARSWPARILSDVEVHEIRLFRDQGWTRIRGNAQAIGLAYGVSRMTVAGIGCRNNRANLPERA